MHNESNHHPHIDSIDSSIQETGEVQDDRHNIKRHHLVKNLIGYTLVFFIVASLITSSEASNYIMRTRTFHKPFFIVYTSTIPLIFGFVLEFIAFPFKKRKNTASTPLQQETYVPLEGKEDSESSVLLSDKTQDGPFGVPWWKRPFMWGLSVIQTAAQDNNLSIKQLCLWPLPLSVLWFMANYAWFTATPMTSVATGTTIYQASTIFVLFMSVVALCEVLTLAKLSGVTLCVCGVVLITWMDAKPSNNSEYPHAVWGDLIMLLSAFLYPLYEVIFIKVMGEINNSAVNIFSGFIGLYTLLLYWPAFILLDVTGLETFVFPTGRALAYVIVNALLSFIVSYGVNWGVMLTSPLFLRVGVMCTVPATILIQVLFIDHRIKWYLASGAAMVVAGFILVSISRAVQTKKEIQRHVREIQGQETKGHYQVWRIRVDWV